MTTKPKVKKKESQLRDNEFHYGDVEMTDEEYKEAQNPKIRTTMFLEKDLVQAYKQEATRKGLKYQQLMREKLREGLDEDSNVDARLKRLEKIILKKRA